MWRINVFEKKKLILICTLNFGEHFPPFILSLFVLETSLILMCLRMCWTHKKKNGTRTCPFTRNEQNDVKRRKTHWPKQNIVEIRNTYLLDGNQPMDCLMLWNWNRPRIVSDSSAQWCYQSELQPHTQHGNEYKNRPIQRRKITMKWKIRNISKWEY